MAGCGTNTTIIRTVVRTPASSAVSAPTTTTDGGPATVPTPAQVGETLAVHARGAKLRVTVTSVMDPLAVGPYDTPTSGTRFVGVALAVRNLGPSSFSDSMSNGSTLILADDEQADTTIVSGGPCGNSFGSDVKIAPGDTRVGCIAFEVPKAQDLRSYQFTPDSGFADQTAEWSLPRTGQTGTAPSADGHALTACDPQISVRAGVTTCAFAENVFYEYYTSGQAGPVEAYSPALGRMLHADCIANATSVDCTAGDGGEVRFSLSAINNYSQSQADRYAATHRTRP